MKTLQNNFTTQEQSKRLLELGVPADSANYFYSEGADIKYGEVYFEYNTEPEILPESVITGETMLFSEYKNKYTNGYILPCWSVGRLIEIICNCHVITNQLMENWICCDKNTNLIELLIRDIEVYVNTQHIDFSKLEE